MPPANISPIFARIVAVSIASTIRKTTAAAKPQKITLRRCGLGTCVAARPITTALSPAIVRSIRITWISAAKAGDIR